MILSQGGVVAQAVSLGGGIGLALTALSLLFALAAAATFLSFGSQRGRIQKVETRNGDLEATNKDLRDEIADEKRRHDGTRQDLQALEDRSTRQQSTIDHLKGEIDTLSRIPLEAMSENLAHLAEQLNAFQIGQELQAGMILDLLHMSGDQRDRQTIAQAMKQPPAKDAS